MTTDLLVRARTGDGQAFAQLTDPYRRELHVHCYRILGSTQDAEDALQETLLSAWRGLGDFEERSTLRTWLYRIATSRCLDALRAASRRPQMDVPIYASHPPEPTQMGEVIWLEPYPDLLLEGLTDPAPGPDSHYEAHEAISLAFVTALQLLPPRQRVVLVLRDVLGFRASEVALMLETTDESVTSALKRARVALNRRLAESSGRAPAPAPNSPPSTSSLSGSPWRMSPTIWTDSSRCSAMTSGYGCRQFRLSTKDASSPASSSPPWHSARAAHSDSSRPGPTASRLSACTSATRTRNSCMRTDSSFLP